MHVAAGKDKPIFSYNLSFIQYSIQTQEKEWLLSMSVIPILSCTTWMYHTYL